MLDMLGEKPEQEVPPDMLFSDAVRRWLEDVRHRVDEVTYQGYEVQARAHILPYFDDLQIRLCDVDGETLQTYINVKAKSGVLTATAAYQRLACVSTRTCSIRRSNWRRGTV